MMTAKPLVIRTGFGLSTPKMADLAAGATTTLHETRQLPDGTTRACVQLSGTTKGWCTMISRSAPGESTLLEVTSDEAIALQEASIRHRRPSSSRGDMSARGRGDMSARGRSADEERGRSADGERSGTDALSGSSGSASARSGAGGAMTPRSMPTYVISAPKPLLARGEFDLQSSRVGELAPGTKVHVLETRALSDGGKRVRLSLQGQSAPYGWVTAVTKSGQENLQPHLFEVVAAKPLLVRSAFDTKVQLSCA